MALVVAADEDIIVDVTAPLSRLAYPVIRLTLLTALCWMGIGYIDQPQPYVIIETGMRNIFVGIWFFLAFLSLGVPIIKNRRNRLVLTDSRIIIRHFGIGSHTESIPLYAITGVRGKGKKLLIAIEGYAKPIMLDDVPRAGKIARLIEEECSFYHV
ncbi:hypothetical protein [Corynebacterium sp. sy039]|uniref:hypothetical protein n=1 Tax=Corynebacterium sp. sy039 TaxID=2599641 RepID=UPI0011B6550E|nr:hypothetical protein [Corynebacterium sp. sy039]QDZ42109.1 hypothetical protein FQV43_02160 [Corynebacterium sp. sy039]